MAHRYGHPIRVVCDAGQPRHFSWREANHLIVEVLATWHLRDRWWAPPGHSADGTDGTSGMGAGASDRHYYRVLCADGLLCDLYYDAAWDGWVLDRVHD